MNPSFTFLGSTPSILEIKWTETTGENVLSHMHMKGPQEIKEKSPKAVRSRALYTILRKSNQFMGKMTKQRKCFGEFRGCKLWEGRYKGEMMWKIRIILVKAVVQVRLGQF